MKLNLGTVDRIVRILAAITLAILFFTHQISGLTAILLLSLGGILLITALIGVCPLYLPFGISTRKRKA